MFYLDFHFLKLLFGRDYEDETLLNICLRTCYMTKKSYFGNQNTTLGSVVPLAMFIKNLPTATTKMSAVRQTPNKSSVLQISRSLIASNDRSKNTFSDK